MTETFDLTCLDHLNEVYASDPNRSEADLADLNSIAGIMYSRSREFKKGQERLIASKETNQQLFGKSSLRALRSGLTLAESYMAQYDYSKASSEYNEIIRLTQNTPITNQVVGTNNIVSGRAFLGRALATAFLNDSEVETFDTQTQILSDLNDATDHAQKSLLMARRTVSTSLELINDINDAFLSLGNDNTTHLNRRDVIASMFKASEVGRTVSLRLRLQQSNAQKFARIPDSLLSLERSLIGKIESSSFALQKLDIQSTQQSENEVRRQLINATQSYDSLITVFENNYPAYYDLKHNSTTATVEDIQKYLTDNDAFIEYVTGSDSTYAFVITSNSISLTTIGASDTVRAAVETYRDGIVSKHDSLYFVGARKSHRLLIQTIERHVGDRNLIIVPDGYLSFVPFEPLLDARNNTSSLDFRYSKLNYFFEDRNISYAYSATVFLETRRKPKVEPSKNLIAFAPVVTGGFVAGTRSQDADDLLPERLRKMKNLPASKVEVERIQRAVTKNPLTKLFPLKSDIYLDENALESTLKDPSTVNYRYVHLATHGFIEEDNPELSSLVLRKGNDPGEDGLLYLGEIYDLNLNADVVVLSACETGLGRVTNNEGVIGMTRGFLYAGARNVVVSLWLANDVAARDTMVPFYRELRKGSNNAEAMRKAKLSFINLSSVHATPYYWAPFIVIGQ